MLRSKRALIAVGLCTCAWSLSLAFGGMPLQRRSKEPHAGAGYDRQASSALDSPASGVPSGATRVTSDRWNARGEPALSNLSQLLSGSGKPLRLHLVFPGSKDISLQEVQFGAAVSQALALRAGYRPVLVSRGTRPQAGKFNVLIGTESELGPSLSRPERARIQNGYLSLRRTGTASDDFLLVVSGKTVDRVADAIISLGLLREQLPDASYASIREVVVPDAAPFMRRPPIASGETYTFAQLRASGSLTEAPESGEVHLELFVPGYLVTDAESPAVISLDHAQQRRTLGSPALPEVIVNGSPLKPSRASITSADTVEYQFPFNWLRPGRNLVVIKNAAGSGSPARLLKAFEDSNISFPIVEGHPTLPDLQLTARTFYPFIGDPSGKQIAVVLGGTDSETVESAWTFLARLAQSANTFFFRSEFTIGELDPSRHNVVIGDYPHLPAELRGALTLEAFQEEHANTPASHIRQISRGTNLKMVVERWAKDIGSPATPAPTHAAQNDADEFAQGRWALLASAPSSQNSQLWNLVLTSFSTTDLRDRTLEMIYPEIWDQIRGDIVRWESTPATLRAHVPGEHQPQKTAPLTVEYPTGKRQALSAWLSSVSGLLFLLVVTSSWVLRKCDEAVVLRQRKPR